MTKTSSALDSDGIYSGMPAREYFAADGLNSSKLKDAAESPAKYKYFHIDGHVVPDKPAWGFGRLLHGMYLEPDTFMQTIHVVDASSRRGKVWSEALADNPDKEVVLISDIEKAAAIVHSLRQNREARELLEGAVFESSIFWDEYDVSGNPTVKAKARPDIWQQHLRVVADLKTTRNASPRAFARAAIDYGYHISAAWYCRGIQAVTGEPVRQWYWIAVETEAPYIVQVYHAPDEWLVYGNDCIDRALAKLEWCETTGVWPGYAEGVQDLELPGWVEFDGGLQGATEQG